MDDATDEDLFDIAELSRRVGMSPLLLRAWQFRYGLLEGHAEISVNAKIFTTRDVARIHDLLASLAEGQFSVRSLSEKLVVNTTVVEEVLPLLLEAFLELDEPAAQALLDGCIDDLSTADFFEHILLPVLRAIGDQWEAGALSVGQEHFASNIIRGRLLELGRGWGEGGGPTAILSCAPGETHEFPLLMTGILLHQAGWSIRYLGANTPIESISEMTETLHPYLVLIAARSPQSFETKVPQLRALAPKTNLAIAGHGATKKLSIEIGATLIEGTPITAISEINSISPLIHT